MTALELALRLVALRQAGLAEPNRGLHDRLDHSFRDELTIAAAWLQTRPDVLERVLGTLATEIAQSRHELGLPVLPAPAWSVPHDPPVSLTVAKVGEDAPPVDFALVDRLAAQLAVLGGRWTLTLDLGDGQTVTARPARVA